MSSNDSSILLQPPSSQKPTPKKKAIQKKVESPTTTTTVPDTPIVESQPEPELKLPIKQTSLPLIQNIQFIINDDSQNTSKKRGRRPKNGKIVVNMENVPLATVRPNSNVILHLKCNLSDLNEYNDEMNKLITDPLTYNPSIPPDVIGYANESIFTHYDILETNTDDLKIKDTVLETQKELVYCDVCKTKANSKDTKDSEEEEDPITAEQQTVVPIAESKALSKELQSKLKTLKIHFYKDNLPEDTKSACFWCTYDYDNGPCYIPKYEKNDKIFGYGSFCRPECAVAFLLQENIDDSVKFERYHLLNKVYAKVNDFNRSIKPAPDPHYLLEKFYGNLSIKEYRSLLKSQHLLLVLEKPMGRILPELHDEKEDVSVANNGLKTGIYKIKRESERTQGPTKMSIIRDKFGIS